MPSEVDFSGRYNEVLKGITISILIAPVWFICIICVAIVYLRHSKRVHTLIYAYTVNGSDGPPENMAPKISIRIIGNIKPKNNPITFRKYLRQTVLNML